MGDWPKWIGLCGSFLPAVLAARLSWEETTISHAAPLAETEFTGVFRFVNAGDTDVTLLPPRSSCGCTVPTLEKTTYAPGESGEIKAVFRYGSRVGPQRKRVMVTTDGGESHALTLAVELPQPVVLEPRMLMWSRAEAPSAKRAKVIVDPQYDAQLTDLAVRHEAFAAELVPGDVPGEWWIEVVPAATDARLRSQIVLTTQQPGTPDRFYNLFVGVR